MRTAPRARVMGIGSCQRHDWLMTNRVRGNVLVAIQFVLLAIIFFVPSSRTWILPAGAGAIGSTLFFVGLLVTAIALMGLGSSLTANPVPLAKGTLKTGGLYGAVRHPIYSGILLAAVSFSATSGSLWSLIGTIALIVLFAVKARFEERLLLAAYPGYAAYAARVGRFVPGVGKLQEHSS
jgi:protein-S-isoprenylcysteine O-methyltransferase Ste14